MDLIQCTIPSTTPTIKFYIETNQCSIYFELKLLLMVNDNECITMEWMETHQNISHFLLYQKKIFSLGIMKKEEPAHNTFT